MARNEFRRRRIGPLDALVSGTATEISPDALTVVLFHGYGADMSDLATLADMIQAPKGTNWVFPNGHLTVPLGAHVEGRAWFPISISALEKTMTDGKPIDFSTLPPPPGLKKAKENALALLTALKVPSKKLVLGGFSQGAMLATELTMQLEEPPSGLAILSGTLINADAWKERAVNLKGFPYFQAHGLMDSVLDYSNAVRLNDLLNKAGWSGKLLSFAGGHEIPPEVIIQLGAYLRGRQA